MYTSHSRRMPVILMQHYPFASEIFSHKPHTEVFFPLHHHTKFLSYQFICLWIDLFLSPITDCTGCNTLSCIFRFFGYCIILQCMHASKYFYAPYILYCSRTYLTTSANSFGVEYCRLCPGPLITIKSELGA